MVQGASECPLPDVSHAALESVLRFCYTGGILLPVAQEELVHLLSVADRMQLGPLAVETARCLQPSSRLEFAGHLIRQVARYWQTLLRIGSGQQSPSKMEMTMCS